MASLTSVALLDTTITSPPIHYSSQHLRMTSRPSSIRRSITKHLAYTSCEQKNAPGNDAEPRMRIDRRKVLLSLGGLYGATALGHDNNAIGSPVVVDLDSCHNATVPEGVTGPLKCCPPFKAGQTKIVDFKFPSQSTPMRVRKPAHEMSGDDLDKYKEAIRIMKEDLSPDDPWHFMQQANIHCAYCNDAYYEVGAKDTPVSVHGSWVFLPWHRFYLYFFERILGKLVGDDTLAIPFWNWDSAEGMSMPTIFTDSTSPLYDEARNPDHLHPPAVIDLQSGTSPTTTTPEEAQEKINSNLLAMATLFDNNLRPANLFLGEPISAGEVINKPGASETLHFPAHLWVGSAETPRLDMGNLFSSARDPLFYSHHCNVDRLWSLYRGFRGNQLEFNDPDWLDAAFYFYDENRDLVRVKVHISLAGDKHIRISWITADKSSPSVLEYGTSPGVYTSSSQGESESYSYFLYRSGKIHNAVIGPLEDDTVYFYRCGGQGSEFNLKTPPSQFPITFAVAGDLGQTGWTSSTLEHIGMCNYDVYLLPGDLSYADCWQHLWDSFGELVQPLASARPWMVTEGNHEKERIPLIKPGFEAYNARWKMPFEESGSGSNLYYSFEVAGVHVIMLGSYADYDELSDQYNWLKADLSKVDRQKTPWLLVLFHVPWYNSNLAHQREGDHMMATMEPLLYTAMVDIVFAGHVHAYERSNRVNNGKVDPCGAVHITIGDGGNREGLAQRYRTPKPDWSVFREASFGHGQLKIVNSTHALWSWHRNDDDEPVKSDQVWINSLANSNCIAGKKL